MTTAAGDTHPSATASAVPPPVTGPATAAPATTAPAATGATTTVRQPQRRRTETPLAEPSNGLSASAGGLGFGSRFTEVRESRGGPGDPRRIPSQRVDLISAPAG